MKALTSTVSTAWILLLLAVSACKKPVTVPPVTEESSNVYHPGKIVWHDLATGYLDESKAFYEGLFNWEVKEMPGNKETGYFVVYNQGKPIGGMLKVNDLRNRKKQAIWLPSLSVMDVDESVKLMKDRGGRVFGKVYDLPGRGRTAIVQDPEGAWLALLHSKNGDPKDITPSNYDWLFDQVWTLHKSTSEEIYQDLVGYEVKTMELGANEMTLFYKDGQMRAGLLKHKQEELGSFWLPFVKVPNLESTVSKVESLGGQVILSSNKQMKVALITDPGGAAIAIQQK